LLPTEHAFVQRFFAHALDGVRPRLRLYVRRLGDTRRALSLPGGRIAMPRQCFEQGDPAQPLRLSHPAFDAVAAHVMQSDPVPCRDPSAL